MRWLLLKDLQILRRSPLLVAMLVAYPVVIALLIGLALSGGPDQPQGRDRQRGPARGRDAAGRRPAHRHPALRRPAVRRRRPGAGADPRGGARAKVRSGEVLGALIVPADVTRRLQAALNLTGAGPRPTVEVVYNAEDPLKARFVESTIEARLAEANAALSAAAHDARRALPRASCCAAAASRCSASRFDVLGLERSEALLRDALRGLPPGSPEARGVRRVADFARIAVDNLELSREVLDSVGSPIALRRTALDGARTPLDAFAVSVAVTISLMFVTVLLAAGLLALEREEHAFGRLVRGLVSRTALLAEKVVLARPARSSPAWRCSAGIGLFVDLDWGRAAALAGRARAPARSPSARSAWRSARSRARCAPRRCSPSCSSLPIAFLALVPGGAVVRGAATTSSARSPPSFPFRPALRPSTGR